MRTRLDPQDPLDFRPSSLKVTRGYLERFRAVGGILAATPKILSVFHRDVSRGLSKNGRKRKAEFTSDSLLRTILVMEVEGLPYRDTVVRKMDGQLWKSG
jgi:hypothetical protein